MVKIPDEIRKQIFNEGVRKNMTPEQRQERSEKIRDAMTQRAYSLTKELEALKDEFEEYKAKHPAKK